MVVGLGNPGPEYDSTRHNVGWWVLDRFAYDQDLGAFEREGKAWVSQGRTGSIRWRLIKPRTWMNRSGEALTTLWTLDGFEVEEDLLVVTDDASLDVARVRLRPRGGSGGHNGLKSVTAALGTDSYARLRVGVGVRETGADMSDWVLSAMPPEDEAAVVDLLPALSRAILVWGEEGTEAAMNQFNT